MPSGKHKRYEKSYFNDLNNQVFDFWNFNHNGNKTEAKKAKRINKKKQKTGNKNRK